MDEVEFMFSFTLLTINVIASITHGESQANMSHVNAVPTICGWLRDENLHDFVDTVDSTDQVKKRPELPKT